MRHFFLMIGICLVQYCLFATTDMEKVFQNQHLKIIFQPEDAWYMDSPGEYPRDIQKIDSMFKALSCYLNDLRKTQSLKIDSVIIIIRPLELGIDSVKLLINKWANRIIILSLNMDLLKPCIDELLNIKLLQHHQWYSPFQWVASENLLLRRMGIDELGEINYSRHPLLKKKAIAVLQAELKKQDILFEVVKLILEKIQ